MPWMGGNDLHAAAGKKESIGPIAEAVKGYKYDKIVLLNNYPPQVSEHYAPWLREQRPQSW